MPDFHEWSCFEIAERVRAGDVSAEEVIGHHLDRIEANADLNAFITVVDRDRALADAASLRRSGRMGALAGVPFAPKDLLDTVGLRTTAGSALFADHVPTRTATSVQLLCDAGAVIVGKTNLHELAWGVTSQNPHYGPVRNPVRPGKIPGGSSGGSAAALAAGLAGMSLGTDTGGSIRIPSSACSIAGFKASWGLVPDDGCFPLAPEMDHVGPMARTMAECALALEVLCGLETPPPSIAGKRVALIHPIADQARLETLGAHVEEFAFPDSSHLLPLFAARCANTHRDRFPAAPERYSPDLTRKLQGGFKVTATEFLAGLDAEAEYTERCEQFPFDLYVNPTLTLDLPDAAAEETPEVRLALTFYTRTFNFLGWPSCTTRDGVQFSGRDDATVLAAALAWEEAIADPVRVWR